MNQFLGLLLSRVYDGALAPEHRADLEKSGLTGETIAAQFIRSVPPDMIGRLLGFDIASVRSAMLLPFASPDGGFADHVRMKIFPPLTDQDEHAVKYLQPKGSGARLYFIRQCLREVLEGDGAVWLVEGEKKSCAVAQLGLPAVGFCGVEGWHRRNDFRLLEDFRAIRLKGRTIEILPDGDYQTNVNVKRAVNGLAAALAAEGAEPWVRHLPTELPR